MDLDFLGFLADNRSEFFNKFFSVFTYAGSEYAAIGIVCLLYWCFNRKIGNRMLLTVLSSLLLNQLLKIIFIARRPWVRNEAKVRTLESAKGDATGYSFPSGYTSNAAAIFGGLVYGDKVRRVWKIVVWVLIALVAFSRMYLGVHTPQDVIVGMALSAALVYAMAYLCKKLEQKPSLDIFVCAGVLVFALATLLVVVFRSFPADHLQEDIDKNRADAFKLVGASVGMAIGWLMERRLIGFEKPAKLLYAVIRFVIGLILVLGIIALAKKPLISLFGDENVAGVVRYFLACFVAIFVWPLCFTKLEKHLDHTAVKG